MSSLNFSTVDCMVFISSCSVARVNVSVAFLSFNSFTSFLNLAITLSFSSETSANFFESSSVALRASSRSCRASTKDKGSISLVPGVFFDEGVETAIGDLFNKLVKNSC